MAVCKNTIAEINAKIKKEFPDMVRESKRYRLKADLCAFYTSLLVRAPSGTEEKKTKQKKPREREREREENVIAKEQERKRERKIELKATGEEGVHTKEMFVEWISENYGRAMAEKAQMSATSSKNLLQFMVDNIIIPNVVSSIGRATKTENVPTTLAESTSLKTKPISITPPPPPISASFTSSTVKQGELKDITNVIGPTTLSIQRINSIQRAFMLWGERHRSPAKCETDVAQDNTMNYTLYFETLAKSFPGKQIDLFVESIFVSRFTKKELKFTKAAADVVDISLMSDVWAPCLIVDKHACKLPPNLRLHYMDFRFFPLFMRLVTVNIVDPVTKKRIHISLTSKYLMQHVTSNASLVSLADIYHSINIILEYTMETISSMKITATELYGEAVEGLTISRIFFYGLKLKKQIAGIRSEKVVEAIEEFWRENVGVTMNAMQKLFDECLDEYLQGNKRYSSILGDTPEDMIENAPRIVAYLDAINKFIGSASTHRVDDSIAETYCLARMFRCFAESATSKYTEPQYVGFYGGDAHTETFRKFIKNCFADEPVESIRVKDSVTEETSFKCLSVKNIDWNDYFKAFEPVPNLRPCPLSSSTAATATTVSTASTATASRVRYARKIKKSK
jgi:hypothetical protein